MTIFVKSFWVLSALHSCWFSQELSELDYPWNLKVLPNVGSWFWFHGGFPQTIHLYEVNAMNLHYPRDMTENLKAIEERIDEYSSVSEVTPWFKKNHTWSPGDGLLILLKKNIQFKKTSGHFLKIIFLNVYFEFPRLMIVNLNWKKAFRHFDFDTFNPLLTVFLLAIVCTSPWVDRTFQNPKAINVQLSARVMQNYNDFVSGMQMARSLAYLITNPTRTSRKTQGSLKIYPSGSPFLK